MVDEAVEKVLATAESLGGRELVEQGGVLAEGEARQCELQGNLEPSSCGQIKQSGMTAENFDEGLLSRSV